MNQMLLKRLLERLGHYSEIAQSGFEVLTLIQRQSFDVIFMDVQMPDLDGIETTRRIRSNPDFTTTPVIVALTANQMDRTRVACLEAGMDDFLTKPISLEDIKAVLERRPTQRLASSANELNHRLDELLEIGDLAFVQDLINHFSLDANNRLKEMEGQLGQEDFLPVQKASHLLKGSAANLGAREFRNLCVVVQEACERLDLEMSKAALHQAKEELIRVQSQLAEWVKTKPTMTNSAS